MGHAARAHAENAGGCMAVDERRERQATSPSDCECVPLGSLAPSIPGSLADGFAGAPAAPMCSQVAEPEFPQGRATSLTRVRI